MQRTLSKKAYKEACKYIPGGVNSPVRALKSIGITPLFVKKAKGVTLTDVDDNKYIDYCMSWGVFILGHSNADINKELRKALTNGTSYGIPTLLETKLARLITESVPSVEKIRFVNSGTEAVMSAVRLARGFTGKNKIIKFDGCYHGHADHLLVAAGSGVAQLKRASSDGVPLDFTKHTLSLPYNDIAAIEETFLKHGKDIAAVILEPVAANMGVIPSNPAFLKKLREITKEYNSLLIFDEVITGFRLGIGGAQQYYGIQPDLTTFGKIIGGGFPVGAYGGRKEIMSLIAPEGPVYQAGTLSGNPIAMTAGIHTLEFLRKTSFYEELESKSQYFEKQIHDIFSGKGIQMKRIGSMFTLFFGNHPINNFGDVQKCDLKRFTAFYKKMFDQGFYFSPSQFEANFLSVAHERKDLDRTIFAIETALKRI